MYSIDIYRTDDAILIHDKPGGWKRALPGLLFWSGGCIFFTFFGIISYVEGPFFAVFIWLFFLMLNIGVLLPYSLWRLNGHDTILIDHDTVRHDWWCFWGRRSRIYPRPEVIKTETNPGGSTLVGGAFGANIRIGKGWRRKLEMYLPLAAERQCLRCASTRSYACFCIASIWFFSIPSRSF